MTTEMARYGPDRARSGLLGVRPTGSFAERPTVVDTRTATATGHAHRGSHLLPHHGGTIGYCDAADVLR